MAVAMFDRATLCMANVGYSLGGYISVLLRAATAGLVQQGDLPT